MATELAQASLPPMENGLLMSSGVEKCLPSMVRNELAGLSASKQSEFIEEFERKSKGLPFAYLCSFLYCHYGFLGRWGMTVIMWIASLLSLGVIGIIWWFIDLFRMPGLVRNYNRDVAIDVMRNLKAIR